jgi:transcriptional regulator with XRE-family HTH domain
MQELTRHIGIQLKTLRTQRGWSLTQAAEETGVSKAMLGQIERGESSPTVATLWKIASGFQASFSQFLQSPPITADMLHPYDPPTAFDSKSCGMSVVSFFPYDSELNMDMLVVELQVAGYSESSAHAAGVIEHVIVIAGQLALTVNGSDHLLAAGEGLRFRADCSHTYRNHSSEKVRFHDIIHYPAADAAS